MFRDDLAAATARLAALERDLSQAQRERAEARAEVERLRALLARHGIDASSNRVTNATNATNAMNAMNAMTAATAMTAASRGDLVYCGACGAANALDRMRCEHCEELLAVSGDLHDPSCPSCSAGRLEIVELGALRRLSCCQRCGGIWLTSRVLPQLLEAATAHSLGFVPKELDLLWEGETRPPRPSYLRCPDCRQMMLRRAHTAARVVVDVCTAHGIWLDHGELPQLLEAAERGAAVQDPFKMPPSTIDGAGLLGGATPGETVLDWLGALLVAKVRRSSIW